MHTLASSSSVVLKKIVDAGYEAYYVGGCVRDLYLGKVPKDYDITTNAHPEQIEAIFKKTIPTGKAYGTITVLESGFSFEVTTYRLESDYDGRRPKVVRYADNLLDDLARRDFTMNAMAMDLSGKIIDPFYGRTDLNNGILRFVGNPIARIAEDRIRILRYIRFLCQYDLHSSHLELHKPGVLQLGDLSAERIREEMNKILMSDAPVNGFRLMAETKVLGQFFPELQACVGFEQHHPAHHEDVFSHTLSVVANCEQNLMLRLAALCHDLGKVKTLTFDEQGIGHFYGHQKISAVLADQFMRRLKYANREIEAVTVLIEYHMRVYENAGKQAAKRLMNSLSSEHLDLLFKLQIADTSACAGDRSENVQQIIAMRQLCETLLESDAAFRIKDLAVNGFDLMALGFNGPEVGSTLDYLLELVITERCENHKPTLLAAANQLRNENP